jgi:hypothetical protein
MIGATRRELRLATSQRRSPLLFLTRKALLLSGVAMAALTLGISTASASTQEFSFHGSAWGTSVRVGNVLKSGPSAFVPLACTTAVGITHTNTVASVHVPNVLSSGTVNTRAASKATKTGIASTSSATTQHISLLGGAVTATAIKSVSTTSHNTSTGKFKTSAAGTHFVNLVVGGQAFSGTPPANTKIPLPGGIGFVVLNQQTSHIGSNSARMTVIGVHVVITKTSQQAKSGTQIEVSVANSSLNGPIKGALTGLAFGTSANVGNKVIAGKSFPKYMPCLGTGGKTRDNTGAGVNLPGVLTSGTIRDTANGTVTSTEVFGRMTSTIQAVNLLSGAVRANVIKADVSANGNPPTLRDRSSFLGLHVVGHPGIPDNVPANTKVNLPAIGTLWLHKRVKTKQGIRVIMIQLVIGNASNPFGLPMGATVDVGFARVGVS